MCKGLLSKYRVKPSNRMIFLGTPMPIKESCAVESCREGRLQDSLTVADVLRSTRADDGLRWQNNIRPRSLSISFLVRACLNSFFVRLCFEMISSPMMALPTTQPPPPPWAPSPSPTSRYNAILTSHKLRTPQPSRPYVNCTRRSFFDEV